MFCLYIQKWFLACLRGRFGIPDSFLASVGGCISLSWADLSFIMSVGIFLEGFVLVSEFLTILLLLRLF